MIYSNNNLLDYAFYLKNMLLLFNPMFTNKTKNIFAVQTILLKILNF